VLVTDANDNPVAGKSIDWTVQSGGGNLSGTASSTDSSGYAQISYTLGTVAGASNNTVDAKSMGL
jgi:hypothetical protein